MHLRIYVAFSLEMIVQEEEIHEAMHDCNEPKRKKITFKLHVNQMADIRL